MPPRLVDGELWAGRDRFQEMGAVRKKVPLDEEWLNITFQVYDMPEHPGTFEERTQRTSEDCSFNSCQVERDLVNHYLIL